MYRGPRFVMSIKIETNKMQEDVLNHDYFKCNRLYNNCARYAIRQVAQIKRTRQYKNIVKLIKKIKEKKDRGPLYLEIKDLMVKYKITKSDLEKYMKEGNEKAFNKTISSDVFQTLAKELYLSVESSLFKGTDIKYRKFGETNTLSSKAAKRTIIFNKEKHTFKYNGLVFKLKDTRDKDFYAHEALESEIILCKIVRRLIGCKYAYYLQITFKGLPPKKIKKGQGRLGIDQGTSTIAIYSNNLMDFIELAPRVKEHNKEILKLQRKIERKRRLNNPDCFNDDGTIKKGAKFKNSNRYKKAVLELRDAYRRKTDYVKSEHNKIAKLIVGNCDTLVKETLNFKALQKRSKGPAKRQDKESKIEDKNGNIKKLYKFKRKKRFGRSLNNHSPGYLDAQILKRAEELGINVVKVDMLKYRASQYRHDKDDYVKVSLGDRYKEVYGQKVQRDLYSAFLIYNFKDEETIDRDKCIDEFDNFISQQNMLIKNVKDNTGNFGLRNFQ